MKNKIFFTALIAALSLQGSCQTDSTKLKEESLSIIYLLYNMESNKFPPPPPPNSGLSKSKPRKKNISDKHIDKKKYVIAIRENGNIEYKKGIDLSTKFKNILANSELIFMSKKLIKADLIDVNGNKIPIISSNESLKIQDVKRKHKVLGVLFLSNFKFNKHLNKAVLQFGSYTHGLSGYTAILCLEKKHGTWEIVYSKNQSES